MATSMKNFTIILASLFSLIFGAVGGGLTSFLILSQFEPEPAETVINFENGSYKSVWEAASPAVVSVVAFKDVKGELVEMSSGTGFIITPDGFLVTNKHVVADDGATYIVILEDGTQLDAEVLDRDSLNDIALVQITGEDERLGSLPALDFADSDQISVGDPVVAIGNALGEYSNTTTVGIISATGREIIASSGFGSSENLVNLIQTDAAINPGNSGGPLLNMNAEVVGMNTAIDTTASGIGFAIPANDIATVVKSYQEFGRIVRPFVGVRYIPVTPAVQERFQIEAESGMLIIGDLKAGAPGVVEDSPADDAGLKEKDVILEVEGKALTTTYSLANAIAGYLVGETITLKVWRDGEILSIQVKLEESAQ
ncbi:MAG: trypsin-like peptidase domain-containing protein [Candidatus Gracilibacteria bacterium]|jgi:serine protease Do